MQRDKILCYCHGSSKENKHPQRWNRAFAWQAKHSKTVFICKKLGRPYNYLTQASCAYRWRELKLEDALTSLPLGPRKSCCPVLLLLPRCSKNATLGAKRQVSRAHEARCPSLERHIPSVHSWDTDVTHESHITIIHPALTTSPYPARFPICFTWSVTAQPHRKQMFRGRGMLRNRLSLPQIN